METYKRSDFQEHKIPPDFLQDNHSFSKGRGVLRGLHYQKAPAAQGKLIRCARGEIFDVAVDIRKGSPTYRKWVGVSLSEENHRMVWIPPGFAHGFCVLSTEASITYKVTQEYAAQLDRGILWNDPDIGIQWPVAEPILSAKDALLPLLKDADNDFMYGV